MGATCQKADYFECVLITKSGNEPAPIDKWYLYCVNQKTEEEKTLWLKDAADKCIRNPGKRCKFLVTDTDEKELLRKHYKDQCEK